MKKLVSYLFSVVLLTGCGQTGPLYLPDQKPPVNIEKTKSTSQSTQDAQAHV